MYLITYVPNYVHFVIFPTSDIMRQKLYFKYNFSPSIDVKSEAWAVVNLCLSLTTLKLFLGQKNTMDRKSVIQVRADAQKAFFLRPSIFFLLV